MCERVRETLLGLSEYSGFSRFGKMPAAIVDAGLGDFETVLKVSILPNACTRDWSVCARVCWVLCL